MKFATFLKILMASILGIVSLGAVAHMGAVGFNLISGSAEGSAAIFILTGSALFIWMAIEAIG